MYINLVGTMVMEDVLLIFINFLFLSFAIDYTKTFFFCLMVLGRPIYNFFLILNKNNNKSNRVIKRVG